MHKTVRRAATDGDLDAQKMLGRSASDTALKIILLSQRPPDERNDDGDQWDLLGFDLSYYAYEEAAASVILEKSHLKEGVFQVVIGTEPRASRKEKALAERPKSTGKSRACNVTESSRPAPKSRKKLTGKAA